MKRNWWKRGLSTLLAVAMVLTAQPFTAGNIVVYASELEEISVSTELDALMEEPESGSEEKVIESEPEQDGTVEEISDSGENVEEMVDSGRDETFEDETEPEYEDREGQAEDTEDGTETDIDKTDIEKENPFEESRITEAEDISEISREAEELEEIDSEQVLEPVEVEEEMLQSEPEPEVFPLETVTYVNPLYEDVVEPSDLNEVVEDGIMTIADEPCTSLEEAALIAREQMKSRNEQFSIQFQSQGEAAEDAPNQVMDGAMEHTGVSTEGDYLKWQYAGWKLGGTWSSSGGVYTYTWNFALTYYTTAEQEAEMDNAVGNLLSELNLSEKTDYKKICGIYDYICANVDYDNANLNNADYKLKFTAYAALMNKTAVCQGYAVLFYRLALELGVDARLIAGTGNGGAHGWNIVQLGGNYYNLDSTWDANREPGDYQYFLKATENFGDHIRNGEYDTTEFNEAYPMSFEDYVADESGLVFAADLRWEWNEESQTDRISGINLKDGEGYLSLSDTEWVNQIESVSISQLEEPFCMYIPNSYMALFFKEYNEAEDSYSYTLLSSSNITLSEGTAASVTDRDDYYLEFHISKPETFEVSYTTDEGKTYRLPVEADWPEIGIFSAAEESEEAFLNGDCRFNNDHRTFFLRLVPWGNNGSISLDPANPFRFYPEDGNQVEDFLTCTPVEGSEKWYEITLNPEIQSSFELEINAVITDGEAESWNINRNIWFSRTQDSGLALASDLDFDDEGNINGIWANEEVLGSDDKEAWVDAIGRGDINHSWPRDGEQIYSIPSAWFTVFLAEYDINSEEDYTFTPVPADQIRITGNEGENFTWEITGDYIGVFSETGGSCTLSYTTDDGRTYTQEVVLGLPGAGFYSSPSRDTGSFLSDWQYWYNSGNRDFFLIYDAARGEDRPAEEVTWEINGNELAGEELAKYISVENEVTEDSGVIVKRISVAADYMDDFQLTVKVPYVSVEDPNDIEEERADIHVSRGQDTGLVFTADFEWDDNGNIQYIHEDSYSLAGDDYIAELTEGIFSLAFCQYSEEENDWVYTPLSYGEVSFVPDDSTANMITLESVSGNGDDIYLRLVSNTSESCPSGVIQYRTSDGENEQVYELNVAFCYPEVGFYYDEDHTRLIPDEYIYSGSSDQNETIYLYTESRDENQEIRISAVATDEGKEVDYTPTAGLENCYAVSLSGFEGDIVLYVDYVNCNKDSIDGEINYQGHRELRCVQTGLVAVWPEFNENGYPYVPEDADWMRAVDMTISNSSILAFGLRDSSGNVEQFQGMREDAFSLSSEDVGNGYEVHLWFWEEEQDTSDFAVVSVPASGQYTLSYLSAEDISYSMKINAGLPQAGFYTSEIPSDETYLIDQEFIYNSDDGAQIYMVAFEDGNPDIRMENLRLEVEDGLGEVDGYLTYEDVTPADKDYVVWKVTIRANASREFGLRVRADYFGSDEDGNTWYAYDTDGYAYVRNEAEKTRISYYDGEAYSGYRVCFISEMEFKTGYLNTYYGDPVYWVHGDTITEAMEKLVALSGSIVTASDGTKLTITNTGYIHVGTSTFYEYKDDLKEEGVIIPDGILGVQIDEDYSRQFLMAEQAGGSYTTDQNAQVYRAEGGNVEFLGITFWIEEGSTFAKMDGTWYYCEPVSDGNGYVRCVEENGEYSMVAGGNPIAGAVLDLIIPVADNVYMVYDKGAAFPALHIAASADVTINGSGISDSISVGFYEGSDTTVTLMDCKDVEHINEDGSADVYDDHIRITADSESGTFEKYIYYNDGSADYDVTGIREVAVSVHRIQPWKASLTGSGASAASWVTSGLETKLTIPAKQRISVIDGDERTAVLNVDTVSASAVGSAKVTAINTAAGVLLGSTYYDAALILASGGNEEQIGSITGEKLSLTLAVPSTFDQSQGTVKVVRYYNGKAEVLNSTVKSGNVTFQTDKTGIFAVVLVSNLNYKVTNTSSKTMAVTGTSASTATKLVIPATVQYKGGSYKVTAINSSAFKGNTKLKNITIGANVTSVGASAFQSCTALTAFTGGAAVTTIGNNAFYGCTALSAVTIPAKVTSIGTAAFRGCTKLATVKIGAAVKTIGNNAFYGCSALKTLTIGAAVTTIGNNAFYGCKALAKVTIPARVTSIGTSAFQGCVKLATLTIGAAVTKIGDKAFYGCTALTKVTVPNKVTTIGASAFYNCTKLATLTIGTGVTTIGSSAFYGCKALKIITISTTKLTTSKVGSNAFKGIYAKAKIKVPSSKLSAYQALLQAKGVSSGATITK